MTAVGIGTFLIFKTHWKAEDAHFPTVPAPILPSCRCHISNGFAIVFHCREKFSEVSCRIGQPEDRYFFATIRALEEINLIASTPYHLHQLHWNRTNTAKMGFHDVVKVQRLNVLRRLERTIGMFARFWQAKIPPSLNNEKLCNKGGILIRGTTLIISGIMNHELGIMI